MVMFSVQTKTKVTSISVVWLTNQSFVLYHLYARPCYLSSFLDFFLFVHYTPMLVVHLNQTWIVLAAFVNVHF